MRNGEGVHVMLYNTNHSKPFHALESLGMRFRVSRCEVEEVSSRTSHPKGKVQRDPELKKAHKQAVKDDKRERRKNKAPKHVKKRKEKMEKRKQKFLSICPSQMETILL